MKPETVREWEEQNKQEYPLFAAIWYYDAYGETWTTCIWREQKSYYEHERTQEGWTILSLGSLIPLNIWSMESVIGGLLSTGIMCCCFYLITRVMVVVDEHLKD